MRFIKTLKSRNGKSIDFAEIETQISVAAKDFRLRLIYLYGSYAFDNASRLSDLDIAVLSNKKLSWDKYLSLIERFQFIFEEEAIDLVDLNSAPLTLIHRIFKYGRCLYASSISEKIDFEIKKENLYFDTAPIRREYGTALIRRIKNGTFGHR